MLGNRILELLGQVDPRRDLAAAALRPGAGTATPGGTGAVGGATLAQPRGGAPGTPPAPQAYQTPPDLLELYTEITDRQNKENRIDRGIGLIASSFAQPQNRGPIMEMMGGGGGTGSSSDVLSTIMEIQAAQNEAKALEAAQADKERQLSALPAIAETYGIDMNTARMLFDNDQMDDFIMEKSKYQDADTSVVKDESTGIQRLINNGTGETIMEIGGGLKPTNDAQRLMEVNADRENRGLKPYSAEEFMEYEASLKKPSTSVTVHNEAGESGGRLTEGFDDAFLERHKGVGESVKAIGAIQNAQRALAGGVVAGNIFAPATLEGRKALASMFGLTDDAAANTEVLRANLSAVVRANIKDLGTGNAISNSDREFMEKEIGMNMSLTEESIQRLLDIQEQVHRQKISEMNAELDSRADRLASKLGEDHYDVVSLRSNKYDVPDLMPETKSRIVERIPDGHRAALVEAASTGVNTEEAAAEFDSMYGRGASEMVLELYGG